MKLTYYSDTDSLYVEFTERPSVESVEIAAGVIVDFDGQGRVVGIDIDNARNKTDLDRVVISNVPALIEVDRRIDRIDNGLPEPLPANVTLPVPREHLEILKARRESPATWLDWEEVKASLLRSEAAIRAELPWLLERGRARDAAASEDTVSGRLRRAVTTMRQPYEQFSLATGIPFQDLADFMAGGQLPSDALDRLATAAHCELVARGSAT